MLISEEMPLIVSNIHMPGSALKQKGFSYHTAQDFQTRSNFLYALLFVVFTLKGLVWHAS